MFQENVQQQLVQVLNTKHRNNSNTSLNTNNNHNNFPKSVCDQKNVVSDSLVLEQKCAPEAANSCVQIPVGNNLPLQIQKENVTAKTCLIRETTNSSDGRLDTIRATKAENVDYVCSGKVKLVTNEITYGVDKLNLNDESLKCGNELVEAAAVNPMKITKMVVTDNKQNLSAIQGALNYTSHQQNQSALKYHKIRSNQTNSDFSEKSLKLSNCSVDNFNDSKSKHYSSSTINSCQSKNSKSLESSKSSGNCGQISPKDAPYRSATLTDRYLKTLATISAASDGKSDLQTILQKQRLKSENNLLQLPLSARVAYNESRKTNDIPDVNHLRRIGSTESINLQIDGDKTSPAFISLRHDSNESLVTLLGSKRCNSEDNLSVFSGRYDPVDVSSHMGNKNQSSIVKAHPALVMEDNRENRLSVAYDNIGSESQHLHDELYESIAGSSSDISAIEDSNPTSRNDVNTSFSSSTASSFSR